VEEQENHQLSNSTMTSTPVSPSNITPITNNILMDVDSDAEAEQAALEPAQAQ